MFELLFVIGLVVTVGLVVLALKLLFFAVVLPLKIGAGILKLIFWVVIGLPLAAIGLALLTAAIPVALVAVPVLLVFGLIAFPFILLAKAIF
ncbi:MAG: hypothetical protein Kow001_04640 [Acidobacteriota bacterium]